MARYIDADKLIEFITKGLNNPDNTKAFGYDAIVILTEIEYAPTTDVAPKSEVERLEHILDCYALQYGTVTDQQKVIEKAKSEVAREIFEKIEESIATHAYTSKSEDYMDGAFDTIEWVDSKIDELKKKYTEGCGDEE